MNAAPLPDYQDDLELDTDACIEACGDARSAVRALLVANSFLESELAKALARTSTGYARGQNKQPPSKIETPALKE